MKLFCLRTSRYLVKRWLGKQLWWGGGSAVICVSVGQRTKGPEAPGGCPGDVWEAPHQSQEAVCKTDKARPACGPTTRIVPQAALNEDLPATTAWVWHGPTDCCATLLCDHQHLCVAAVCSGQASSVSRCLSASFQLWLVERLITQLAASNRLKWILTKRSVHVKPKQASRYWWHFRSVAFRSGFTGTKVFPVVLLKPLTVICRVGGLSTTSSDCSHTVCAQQQEKGLVPISISSIKRCKKILLWVDDLPEWRVIVPPGGRHSPFIGYMTYVLVQ